MDLISPSHLARIVGFIHNHDGFGSAGNRVRHIGAYLPTPTHQNSRPRSGTLLILRRFSFAREIASRVARFLRSDCMKLSFAVLDGDRKKSTLIVFSMEIVVADQMRTALLRTLGSVLEPTRVAPGCLSARLFSDLDKRKSLLLVEEWESREQFERNLDTAKLNAIVGRSNSPARHRGSS